MQRTPGENIDAGDRLDVDRLLGNQGAPQRLALGLGEAAQHDVIGSEIRGTVEDRETARARESTQQHVERDRVDLGRFERRRERATRLDGREQVAQVEVLGLESPAVERPPHHQSEFVAAHRFVRDSRPRPCAAPGPRCPRTHAR